MTRSLFPPVASTPAKAPPMPRYMSPVDYDLVFKVANAIRTVEPLIVNWIAGSNLDRARNKIARALEPGALEFAMREIDGKLLVLFGLDPATAALISCQAIPCWVDPQGNFRAFGVDEIDGEDGMKLAATWCRAGRPWESLTHALLTIADENAAIRSVGRSSLKIVSSPKWPC